MSTAILCITITLSNGGRVVYELSKKYYTQHIQFTDNEGQVYNCLTLSQLESYILHEVSVENDEIVHQSKPVSKYYNWSAEAEFYDSLKAFRLGEHHGLELIKPVTKSISLGQFYLQVEALSQLYDTNEYLTILPIIKDNYILAFLDGMGTPSGELVRPTGMKVEWKESFSEHVQENMKYLTD